MNEWIRPQPTINDETAPFWEATKRHRFLLQRCQECGKVQHYYRGFCAYCWSTEICDEEASGDGVLWSFSVIWKNRAPGFADMTPYSVAVVELAEGVKVCCNLDIDDPNEATIGMPVRLGFVDATELFALPVAKPTSAPSGDPA